ncbi:transmembrane protein 237A-like isoform X2 [Portunus trituberculatus]|uniref:Transmembrane protein 237 n=2 Tax=Portunus trituberculatus TaxID=210409 RepID=A0A5B7EEU7_PORTR|nr:transmembrane protein 237A-like isoform X2 [Portunus trituberculatus]XP_045112794.1 transmembrane protein 237A-like isoform X2 [Portunus trituberculatus]XP_045112795.1 transmembrane protein 237A-like isoform X2 [Portunus trituberculatus]XP_045112796.1 transmembrane protein 237A-like isoform X2 [Portunus trituberculatus]MPC31819.1 Transmembrane protein 237 [Portunus trituberculatus]
MREAPRTASARSSGGGSRRRRWEMKSKESFEKSLAVEIESPPRKSSRHRRDSKWEPSADSPEGRNPFFREPSGSSPPHDFSHKNEKVHQDSESDLLSSKLSALIEEASVKSKEPEMTPLKEKRRSSLGHFEQKPEKNLPEPQCVKPGGETLRSLKDRDKAQVLNDKFETKSLKVAGETPRKMEEGEEKTEQADYTPSAPPISSPEMSKMLPTKKKKDRRKKNPHVVVGGSTNNESYITVQLQQMEEDVIGNGKEEEQCVLSAPALLFNTTINPAGTISTIYQEKLGGFVIARNDMEGVQRKNEELRDTSEASTPSSHAIFLQSGFRTFSVLCQGLLAGLTLAHCLMIFLLEGDASKLQRVYPPTVAQVFFGLVLFLTSLCLVAAFDRCDLIGVGVFSGHGIRMPWTPALYISCMVLSLVAVRAENVLINYSNYVDEVVSEEKVSDLVDWWRWMCVARTSLAVLAWLAVVPDPHTDALLDALQHSHSK